MDFLGERLQVLDLLDGGGGLLLELAPTDEQIVLKKRPLRRFLINEPER